MPRLLSIFALLALSCAAWMFAAPGNTPSSATASPVLVELFTSEGCSDCPPADALLAKFDAQSASGVRLIVLSEHVDYWDHIGWKDPYSSHSYSERQSAYGNHFGLASIYTPQMVVDGTDEFVGSNGRQALAAFQKAANHEKTSLRISNLKLEQGTELRALVESGSLPNGSHKAEIFVAVALNHAESEVARGENAGHHLTHVAVVRNLVKVGDLRSGGQFSKEVSVKIESGLDPRNLRLIAFVQEPGPGRVLGAAVEKLGN